MSAPDRRVRRLRVRATTAQQVRRTAHALEDALRTASLPDAGARLWLVRQLALGRVAADASPQQLALRIEQACARISTEAQAAAQADDGAAAVWFRDALDAHVQAARRLARGEPLGAWFWRAAIPALPPQAAGVALLRALAYSLAARAEAATALPAWVRALHESGHGAALLASLRPGDGAVLARLLPSSGAAGVASAADDRRAFIARALVSGDFGSAPAPSPATATPGGEAGASAKARPRTAGEAPRRIEDALAGSPTVSGSARSQREPGPARLASSLQVPPAPAAPRSGKSAVVDRASRAAARSDGVVLATAAGGLLFLLNLLARVGYADWLAAHPRWQQAAPTSRLFARLLARLRIAPDDAAWSLAAPAAHDRALPDEFVAPAAWRGLAVLPPRRSPHALHDASGRLLLAAGAQAVPDAVGAWVDTIAGSEAPDALRSTACAPCSLAFSTDAVADAWLIAARRWLRRRAQIGYADLVRRPGQLALTPTHADVWLPPNSAELRLRRAGLDLDCGWLPWFGRVVNFHYGNPP